MASNVDSPAWLHAIDRMYVAVFVAFITITLLKLAFKFALWIYTKWWGKEAKVEAKDDGDKGSEVGSK